ncbi:multidrug efflux RND transporter AdeIJK outer membrane channel subunit AdeK [Acinetobacter cumulans]|jgi:multidrug efflux system outer membrane protein|uniref:Multidrug efflux RND transporter AdeIJK outer membrane channel subunit AdeK n=1 Tax=Acinetobacter cumulans TaxID=2136182 RepID=A0A498D4D9_9GAMM|nr:MULTISPECIES: multidrug efflux RND transporter AdeIJK outer membrane channel subunit AdeK [Acinetobacter]QCO23109.1 multidrug efflux RND transporter AdeIJK outer membrane channel subunit AdeK [Acinetobacter cumulans]QFU78876.1 multidrug efflux RND transporter AdeIJK outer membrane channel subunit AdeK [Acinetobacter cumulans]RKG46315.1 multidrug efflux RND transporter AdeIJK outer membrane channel subunit AdeK [Acinetobacter cumulans]RLL35519.1 multidrug efflux RND transporter AdeIJK outer m
MQNIWSITGRSIAVSSLALALAACQSMRGPEPVAQANIPQSYTASASGTSVAAQGYKDFFADQRLVQVLNLALANNRDLRTAALNIQRAQQQYQITANNQLPTIGASGDVLRQDQGAGAQTRYNVGLGVTAYELDFWGRVRSLKDNALDSYLATASARDATQIALIGQVAQAWLNYSFANANLKLADQTLKAQLESYNLNKKRFDVGIDSEVPVRQAQISVETARNDVANYKTQVAQAQNLLNLLVGEQVPESLLAKQRVTRITSNNTIGSGLPSELLNNRPDIRAAEYKLSAAGANIGAAKARLFPTISLTGSAGYASTDLGDLFKSGSFVWGVGPSINLPIFDWGTRQANIKISETDQQIALSDYEKSIQSAFREVNDALAVRQNIGDRLSAQKRLVDATNTTYKLSNARFRAGIDSYLTVLDAQRTSYASEQGLLLLEQANLNNQVELYKTLGGGIKANTSDAVQQQPSSAERKAATTK